MAPFLPSSHEGFPRSETIKLHPVTLILFILFAVLTIPLFIKHRRRPVHCLGWAYLLAFCILRIVGERIHDNVPSSPEPSIISNSATTLLLPVSVCIVREASVFLFPEILHSHDTINYLYPSRLTKAQ